MPTSTKRQSTKRTKRTKRCPNGTRRANGSNRCVRYKKTTLRNSKTKSRKVNRRPNLFLMFTTPRVNRYTPSRIKYRSNRNSPFLSATEFFTGDRKRGNDGRMYKVIQTSRAKRWVLA